MVQAAEKTEILGAGDAREKTQVRTRMITQMAADRSRRADGIESGDKRGAARREKKRGENAKQGGLSRAVGPEQGYRLARLDPKRNPTESRGTGSGEGLQKGAPAAESRREEFFERINGDRGIRHSRIYSVSVDRKQ